MKPAGPWDVPIRCGDAEHRLRINHHGLLVILDHDPEMVEAFTVFGAAKPHCYVVADALERLIEDFAGWWNPRFNIKEIVSFDGLIQSLHPDFAHNVEAQEAALEAVQNAIVALGNQNGRMLHMARRAAIRAERLQPLFWKRIRRDVDDLFNLVYLPGWEALRDSVRKYERSGKAWPRR
jgi:hypothetical protein